MHRIAARPLPFVFPFVVPFTMSASLLVAGCATGEIDDPTYDPATRHPAVGGADGDAPDDPREAAPIFPMEDATPTPSDDTGDATFDTAPKPPELEPAHDVPITQIAIYQGVKISLAKDGAPVATARARVVAGKEALVRVWIAPSTTFGSREVIARLTLSGATSSVLETTKTITTASTEGVLDSTINFAIPNGVIGIDTNYRVELLSKPGQPPGASDRARFPATGDQPLAAIDTGASLKVTLVPVRYDADGSGRLPDTSEAQLKRYRDQLYAIYPAKKIELTVHAPFAVSYGVDGSGSGFGTLLNQLTKLRQTDGAPKDVYYFGVFDSTPTFNDYCGSWCTVGLCNLVDVSSDAFLRACVGVGFTGSTSAWTMAHELGHAHGLPHAPCGGASGTDPGYPYAGAAIGTWGWDVRTNALIEPSKTKDMMSYCDPSWVSDYNYENLVDRMHDVAAAGAAMTKGPGKPAPYRFVEVRGDGSLVWGDSIELDAPLHGELHDVTYTTKDGRVIETSTAHYYPYADRALGGTMLVPEPRASFATMEVLGMAPGVTARLGALVR